MNFRPAYRAASSEFDSAEEAPSVVVRQAVIMAGGKGTRLHPYSAVFPKPLMPLGDMPIMELLLRRMKAAGIREVIVAVNHLRHLIEVYFGDGSDLGLRLYYCDEDKPLGTAGALGNMLPILDDTFLVTNGDLLTTMDLRHMAMNHISERADATIGIFERENKIDFGLIEFDACNKLSAYREKPTSKYFVSMGVYVLQREAVRPHISNVDYLDMPNLLLKIKAANGSVGCFRDEKCIWLDIGRPDDFALAQKMFEENRETFLSHA